MDEEVIYMAVTADALELPIAVGESIQKLADILGVGGSTVYKQIQHHSTSRSPYMGDHYRIVKVIGE